MILYAVKHPSLTFSTIFYFLFVLLISCTGWYIYEFGRCFYPKAAYCIQGIYFIKTMAVALLASCSIVWTTGTQRRWSKYEKGFWHIYCHTFRNDFHISIYLSFLFVVIFVSQKCLYFILVFYFNLILFRFALPLFWFALCFILLIYLCVCLFFNAIFILCFLDLFVLLCFIFLWFGSFCFTFALFIFLILGTHLKFFLSYVGLCRVMLERLGILIKLN